MFHITHLRFGDMTGYFPAEKNWYIFTLFPVSRFLHLGLSYWQGARCRKEFPSYFDIVLSIFLIYQEASISFLQCSLICSFALLTSIRDLLNA